MPFKYVLALLSIFLIIALTFVNSKIFFYPTLASYFLYSIFIAFEMLFVGIILFISKGNTKFQFSLLSILIILWTIYATGNTYLNIGGSGTFKTTYLIFSCFFYFLLNFFLSSKIFFFRWLFVIITSIVFFEVLICIIQFLRFVESSNSYFNITGTQFNPNITAMFIAMSIPVIFYTIYDKNRFVRNIAGITLFMSLFALYLLKCRSAYIGAFVALVIVFNYKYEWIKKIRNKGKWLLNVVLIIIGITFFIIFGLNLYHTKQASADGRVTIWKISFDLIAKKPLFGYGYGQFEREYNLHQAKYFESGKASKDDIQNASFIHMAYNEFLENTIEGGIIGLLLYIGFFTILMILFLKQNNDLKYLINTKEKGINVEKEKIKKDNNQRKQLSENESTNKKLLFATTVAFSGICAFIVMSLVNFTTQAVPVWCLFLIFASLLSVNAVSIKQIHFNLFWTKTWALLIILMGLYLGVIQSLKAKGFMLIKKSEQLLKQGYAKEALIQMNAYVKYLDNSESFIQEYAKTLFANGNYFEAIVKYKEALCYTSSPDLFSNIGLCYQKIGNITDAKKSFKTAVYIVPNRFYARFQLMNLYVQNGDTINALNIAHTIDDMAIKVPSTEIDQYKNYAKEIIKNYNSK